MSKKISPRSMILIKATAACALMVHTVGVRADAAPVLNEKFSDLEPAIQMLRSEIGQDRRDIVAANMLLTQSEGAVFWPIYDRYRAEMIELGDTRVRLISDFLAHQNAMTQDEAKRLTDESLELEEHRLSVRQSYVKTMSKVLSARTVARFFQIDGKLDAIIDAQLAARIPLIH